MLAVGMLLTALLMLLPERVMLTLARLLPVLDRLLPALDMVLPPLDRLLPALDRLLPAPDWLLPALGRLLVALDKLELERPLLTLTRERPLLVILEKKIKHNRNYLFAAIHFTELYLKSKWDLRYLDENKQNILFHPMLRVQTFWRGPHFKTDRDLYPDSTVFSICRSQSQTYLNAVPMSLSTISCLFS
jgi:hypothetical protein